MDNIIFLDLLFFNCSSMVELPDISKWNIFSSNLDNFKLKLDSLIKEDSDISSIKKNLSFFNETYNDDLYIDNVSIQANFQETIEKSKKGIIEGAYSLSCLFAGCSSLINLPDISKWNLKNTKDISGLFCGCTSLTKLPDIYIGIQ